MASPPALKNAIPIPLTAHLHTPNTQTQAPNGPGPNTPEQPHPLWDGLWRKVTSTTFELNLLNAILAFLGFVASIVLSTYCILQSNYSNQLTQEANDIANKSYILAKWQACYSFPQSPVSI